MTASLSALAEAPAPQATALVGQARDLDAAGRHDDAIENLRRAATLGHPGAMAALGSRLIIGQNAPVDHLEGAKWLAKGAERDHIDALTLMATLCAAGVLAAPDWPGALNYLQRAAGLGSARARGQLRLLARSEDLPDGDDDHPDHWRRLAEAFDPAPWVTPPQRRAICETPRIRMTEAFASPAVCDWLRARAEGRMRPAMMYDGASKTEKVDPHRTCSDYQFDILNTDLVLLLVRERISALTKLPTVAMEPPRVFHYALGEEIKPHYDRCGDGVEGYGGDGGYLGDRIVTFLLYLNDDFEGGELEFPKTGFRCRGAKGDAVYFAHIDPAGKPDPLSLHAGLKITRGDKWVLSQWIHDRPFGVKAPPPSHG